MELLTAAGLIVLGLVLLTGGGEALVRGATAIARVAGLTPAVIGLTVVAMGTSLPELVVSVIAAIGGQPDLAVGNVVGSNIFNIAATLGLTAVVFPLAVRESVVKLEWPFMFAASAACLFLARDGLLDPVEGALLLGALVLFVAFNVQRSRLEVAADRAAASDQAVAAEREARAQGPSVGVAIALVLLGMALLIVGGRLLVDGSVAVARLAGMSERVIGLTIVAAGTGAPELATSLVAAYRRHTELAVANMIGSNVFNICGILGVAAIVSPTRVAPGILHSDFWWMLGTSALLYPFLLSGRRLVRWEGAVLLAAYGLYLYVLL